MEGFSIEEDDEERPPIYKRRRASNSSSESFRRFRSWIVDDDFELSSVSETVEEDLSIENYDDELYPMDSFSDFSIGNYDDDDDDDDGGESVPNFFTLGDGDGQNHELSPIVSVNEDFDNGNNDDHQQQQQTEIAALLTDMEVFDCPICLDQLFTPLYQCNNGHIACSSCCSKLNKKCPFCCMPIDIRCRGLEKFIDSIIISCKYAQNGCNKMIPYLNKIDHEQMCPHTTCFCPQPSCSFTSTARGVYVHFDRQHPASITRFEYNTTFSVSIELNRKQLYLQQQPGTVLFILNHQVKKRGRVLYIDCVGRDRLKNMFEYQFTVESGYSLIWCQSVPEITQKSSKDTPTKSYLTVPSEFADNNGLLSLSVCINKIGVSSEIDPADIDFWYDHDARIASKVVLTDPDILDCSSCLELLSTPVFQCENSHLVCYSCCSDLKNKCRSCEYDVIRCRGLEKVIESISKISCQNAKNGCEVTLPYDKISEHEDGCPYATCFCPYPSCPFAGL